MQKFFRMSKCSIKQINSEELRCEKVGSISNPDQDYYLYACDLTYEVNGEEKRKTFYFPKEEWENVIKPQMWFNGN